MDVGHGNRAQPVGPLVERTRQDVWHRVHEKLGTEETDDVQALARIARERLRQKYIEAGMGLTGVNFGVAETGTMAPLSPFDRQIMSGLMFHCSEARNVPVRPIPVWTSSMMKSALCFRHNASTRAKYPSGGSRIPALT